MAYNKCKLNVTESLMFWPHSLPSTDPPLPPASPLPDWNEAMLTDKEKNNY